MSAASLTADRRRIARLRETALGLAHPRSGVSAAEIARDLLALQAQDLPGAVWSLGLRGGLTAEEVLDAQRSGELVRSWPMRGTLHLLHRDDLRWMLSLTAERQHAAAAGRHRELDLDEPQFARAADIVRDRMKGGGRLERSELLTALVAGGVPTDGQRGAHLIGALARRLVVVLTGPTEFALVDDVVPPEEPLEKAAVLARLAERYFAGHGPADERDLAWWAGITLGDARAGIAGARGQLEEHEIGGRILFSRPGLEPAAPAVRLLPGFDELLLGYTDRTATLHDLPLESVVPGKNGMFLPTVIVDGRIVATWKRTVGAQRVSIVVTPFLRIPVAREPALRRAAGAYLAHLGRPAAQLELTIADAGASAAS
ncbi:winged helix DNA-binding domain-containing protein [Schumannella soli]|uniref:Winged helix DNA-binding domain-containing protein n=1 Tax=Schumannella soli TaxID=2590779 RepID=A0A506XYK7_9MICO|nr:winged helix DNA-binding domain-containing protein [Schumannella soli]TPW74500.1 winged helix DNA-binding domain-containing protein [Schumannella soli]